jgi:hypothetical protein
VARLIPAPGEKELPALYEARLAPSVGGHLRLRGFERLVGKLNDTHGVLQEWSLEPGHDADLLRATSGWQLALSQLEDLKASRGGPSSP